MSYYVRYTSRGEPHRHPRDCQSLADALSLRDALVADGWDACVVSVDPRAPWAEGKPRMAYNAEDDRMEPFDPERHDLDCSDDQDEPCPEDYTLTPCGPLGSRIACAQIEGSFLGEFADEETALVFIRDRMEREKFWPNVWWVSDHGNWMLEGGRS